MIEQSSASINLSSSTAKILTSREFGSDDQNISWVLENKDWEYLNHSHLISNNPEPPLNFNRMRLQACKLEVTCL